MPFPSFRPAALWAPALLCLLAGPASAGWEDAAAAVLELDSDCAMTLRLLVCSPGSGARIGIERTRAGQTRITPLEAFEGFDPDVCNLADAPWLALLPKERVRILFQKGDASAQQGVMFGLSGPAGDPVGSLLCRVELETGQVRCEAGRTLRGSQFQTLDDGALQLRYRAFRGSGTAAAAGAGDAGRKAGDGGGAPAQAAPRRSAGDSRSGATAAGAASKGKTLSLDGAIANIGRENWTIRILHPGVEVFLMRDDKLVFSRMKNLDVVFSQPGDTHCFIASEAHYMDVDGPSLQIADGKGRVWADLDFHTDAQCLEGRLRVLRYQEPDQPALAWPKVRLKPENWLWETRRGLILHDPGPGGNADAKAASTPSVAEKAGAKGEPECPACARAAAKAAPGKADLKQALQDAVQRSRNRKPRGR